MSAEPRPWVAFLRENKAWIVVPVVVVAMLVLVLVAISASEAAPFIYTLF